MDGFPYLALRWLVQMPFPNQALIHPFKYIKSLTANNSKLESLIGTDKRRMQSQFLPAYLALQLLGYFSDGGKKGRWRIT